MKNKEIINIVKYCTYIKIYFNLMSFSFHVFVKLFNTWKVNYSFKTLQNSFNKRIIFYILHNSKLILQNLKKIDTLKKTHLLHTSMKYISLKLPEGIYAFEFAVTP